MNEDECDRNPKQCNMPRFDISLDDLIQHDVPDDDEHEIEENQPEKRSDQTDPMLSKIELEVLFGMFSLEAYFFGGVGKIHHKMRLMKLTISISATVCMIAIIRIRSGVKK